MEERKMLTVKEASTKVHGVTEYRIRQMLRSGELPYKKAGKKFLIPEDALINYLFSYEQPASSMSTVK